MFNETEFIVNGNINPGYFDEDKSSSATSHVGSLRRELEDINGMEAPSPTTRSRVINANSESTNSASRSGDIEEPLFTVENKPKSDKGKKYKRKKTYVLSAVKCLLSLSICGVLLACVVASKLSLVHIGQRLNYTEIKRENGTSSAASNKNTANVRETCVIMLIFILTIPSVYTFLRAAWSSGLKRTHPWPTKKAITWGLIGSFIEAAGLSLYVIGVLSVIQEANVAIVLMNALFIVPVIWQMSKACMETFASTDDQRSSETSGKSKKKHVTNMLLSFFAIIMQIGGLVGIVFMTSNKQIIDIKFILVPSSILLLSFGWCPKVRKLQIDHDLEIQIDEQQDEFRAFNENFKNERPDVNDSVDISNASTMLSSDNPLGTKKRNKHDKDDTQKVIFEYNTSRGKAAIINSSFKIVLIPFCSLAVTYFMNLASVKNIHLGFDNFFKDKTLYIMFFVQIVSSFVGYHLAWLACTMTMQRLCFALPLTLSTPAAVILLVTNRCSNPYLPFLNCSSNSSIWLFIALLSVVLWLGQFFATTYYAWKNQDFIMANEAVLFWTPSYEGAMLEQNLLLNRKNEATNEYFVDYRTLVKDSRIYICTTMYHEEAFEMEQLLMSIGRIDSARKEAGRRFEAHIFFDDGVREKTLKRYALQLVSLLEKTIDVTPAFALKIEAPYGIELKWKLPGGMSFHIHLKDNFKVKNKKRWSQVMYMSYVLDFRELGSCDRAYILTTDADVKFTPDDVMALMDLMSRDPTVGAVCGRTHPMGSGPIVWYQIFDYAIGHWLLKVAEHVLGSVLCSPGCFSIYRARAIKDVLPTYATHVECAMDFLTKDMGEDRWFCTLLVENGWRLEYCAAAENSTYCPDTFEEFFKQRRRWTPSTLANQIELIQKAGKIRRSNDVITVGFITYQVLLLVSTLIGPANVMLVIASGLNYAFPSLDLIAMFFVVVGTVASFIIICLYTSQSFQLQVAKILTLGFSIIMTITTVGLMAQVSDDIAKQLHNLHTLTLAPSTLYLLFMSFLFSVTALLHGFEGINLVHGLWYLLSLPSGYLFLTIYSIVNMTDRSWGTREGKVASTSSSEPWYRIAWNHFKTFCQICFLRRLYQQSDQERLVLAETDLISEAGESTSDDGTRSSTLPETETTDKDDQQLSEEDIPPLRPPRPPKVPSRFLKPKAGMHGMDRLVTLKGNKINAGARFKSFKNLPVLGLDSNEEAASNTAVSIEEILVGQYQVYVKNFKDNGYDDSTFLFGIREQELLDIGIKNRGHRKKLLHEIERLPPEEMDQEVPDSVSDWLMKLGLENYWEQFKENAYNEPHTLADLKFMDNTTIMQTFQITKKAHLQKLAKAISYLAYPNEAQRKVRNARIQIDKALTATLDPKEAKFWSKLRSICLLPEQAAFGQSDELKGKLEELRNSALMMLVVSNILWVTIMLGIIGQGKKLQVLNTNFLGLLFLSLYTIVLLMQFFTLLWHRVSTWIHLMSRTPFKPGSNINMSWSFHDDDLPPEPSTEVIYEARRRMSSRLERASRNSRGSVTHERGFRTIFPVNESLEGV